MARHLRGCHLCEAMCGVVVETDDAGHVVRIEGDPDDVWSKGYICPKAWGLKELHEDPDRQKRPLRRHGDSWVGIEWDDAIEIAAERLADAREAGGANAVGLYIGNPAGHSTGALVGSQLLQVALDTRSRFTASTLDQLPKQVANWLLYGNQFLFGVPDLDRTDLFVVFGANPIV